MKGENIQELHKLIIDVGRSKDTTKINTIKTNSDYYRMTKNLLRFPLPVGMKNRHDFIKGLVLIEKSLRLGSTSQIRCFMERLDLYKDVELMDWVLANRNNPYVPLGFYYPPLEVKSYSQYLQYIKGRSEHREKMINLDMERSRLAKERKAKIREEHAARKKANDEKRRNTDR